MNIFNAIYGTDTNNVEVTDKLKNIGYPFSLEINPNQVFGIDPAPGYPKKLVITLQNEETKDKEIIILEEYCDKFRGTSVDISKIKDSEFDSTLEYFIQKSKNKTSSNINRIEHALSNIYIEAKDIMMFKKERGYDIFDHLLTLQRYSSECNSIIEAGVRSCVSSYPLLLGLLSNKNDIEKKMISIDIEKSVEVCKFEFDAKKLINFDFFEGNDLDYEIKENVDLLFLDTHHCYGQLKRELKKYSSHINKYIIMHDTTVDEILSESIRLGWDYFTQSKTLGWNITETIVGLWPAILEFLDENKNWRLKERYMNCNGLTILERTNNLVIQKNIQHPVTYILYVYTEGENSKKNLEYFILNGGYENNPNLFYVFIINGYNCSVSIPKNDNVKILQRENKDLDFGGWTDALLQLNILNLLKDEDRIIFLNDTVTGPFYSLSNK